MSQKSLFWTIVIFGFAISITAHSDTFISIFPSRTSNALVTIVLGKSVWSTAKRAFALSLDAISATNATKTTKPSFLPGWSTTGTSESTRLELWVVHWSVTKGIKRWKLIDWFVGYWRFFRKCRSRSLRSQNNSWPITTSFRWSTCSSLTLRFTQKSNLWRWDHGRLFNL